ncbi:hypothetical protein B0H66DRAFT_109231 [Apodospora peruviana]|uniref:Uncharacterized protein n=1 Tax=Apodospora peruviana TaxID=516989 RepID=A0AAE0IHB9_9PEZI|nr:hypothetical protein B0H66DRAFT_109231 [Apodospora peruviana]
MLSLAPMETIAELKSESPVMFSASAAPHSYEKMSVQRKNLPNTYYRPADSDLMVPIRRLHSPPPTVEASPTSPGPKMGVARKPSQIMRDWVKRSGSSRTTKSSGQPVPSNHQRVDIVNLGGGRVGQPDIEPTIDAGLRLPVATRRPTTKNRPSSADSRVTQWIDLYPEAIERFSKSPPEPRPKPNRSASLPTPTRIRRGKQQDPAQPPTQSRTHRDGTMIAELPETDPCPAPAPLRVPSTTKQKMGSDSNASPSSKPPPLGPELVRKNSKWKPLPGLPAQKHQQLQTITTTSSTSIVPQYCGTPPPTPDSATGAATTAPKPVLSETSSLASPNTVGSPEDAMKITIGMMRMPGSTRSSSSPAVLTVNSPNTTIAAGHSGQRHTREERMWLHENYRGEAPFLLAWGLDITRMEDREEGLAILRDLMLVRDGNKSPEVVSGGVNGGKLEGEDRVCENSGGEASVSHVNAGDDGGSA